VVTPNGAYCIDSTEVTNAHYAAFLAVDSGTIAQRPECAWNTSFTPSGGWPFPPDTGRRPVAFVDWCDAHAYCAWAGKRLCGKIGGGPIAPADIADATKSQWFNACSAGGTKAWPYGTVFAPTACNGEAFGAGGPVTVASLASCEGGVPGAYDMSGNVFEWDDSCATNTGGAFDICRVRGGSYVNPAAPLRCDAEQTFYRNANLVNGPYIGFRCCSR
jgi:formylglycine-generating enzyme required for sulfatase activity